MMKIQGTAVLVAALLTSISTGCGGAAEPMNLEVLGELVGEDDVGPDQDSLQLGPDFMPEALTEDTSLNELGEPEDLLVDLNTQPGPGEPGYSCQSDAECFSGFCIQTADGKLCTTVCEEECPFGWECLLQQALLPDMVHICVPPHLDLCRPCLTNDDCWSNHTDGGEKCVPAGDAGSFCGKPCVADADCPDGFGCYETTDVSGGATTQCVPEEECACQPWHMDAGAMTTCQVANEWGVCPGERICLVAGLSDCTAKTPDIEVCNGVDDDCDEEVDEETGGGDCEKTSPHGTCAGYQECDDGVLVCVGPDAVPESCDGLDNDCNGETDEGFEDTDGDGVKDCMTDDKDGDGLSDTQDNCPAKSNPEQADFDLDGNGDLCDLDDDNDLSPDEEDCEPLNHDISPNQDEVCNSKDDNCNLVVDEGFADTDADGFKDCVDEDDDNDGFADADDCGPQNPAVHPGAEEVCNNQDDNCDGQADEGWPDADMDGLADCLDEDQDGDGVANGADNCLALANPDQEDLDQDGQGDACDSDVDGDGVVDGLDNCELLFNPLQADLDDDGMGNECDPDTDGDGEPDDTDCVADDPEIYPGAEEVCNGVDDDCDDLLDEDFPDLDEDGVMDCVDDDDDGDEDPDETDCAPEDANIHAGAVEECNGVDDNCNGLADEEFPDFDLDGLKDCVDNDDDGDGDPDETDCAGKNPAIHAGAVESCNGLDDNCNEAVDEGLGTTSCGVGGCLHTIDNCLDGTVQICGPFDGAGDEVCDGADNDCDGLVDEDLGWVMCGIGPCNHAVYPCTDGEEQMCDPLEGAVDETCDGADNDCDGLVDEELGTATCGLGVCEHTIDNCAFGQGQVCDPMEGATAEVCDGLDNNCDDEIDEDLGQTACGLGICQHTVENCVDGVPQFCNPVQGAVSEVCDGDDNDCDGEIDEDQGTSACGLGECLHSIENCADGQQQVCDPMAGKEAEICDGLDNDCDGLLDEGLGQTSCGLGACLHSVFNCVDGVEQVCDPQEGAVDELCDGLDNDCDSDVDEDFPDLDQDTVPDCLDPDDDGDLDPDETDCAPLDPTIGHLNDELCFNGVDDDCDGEQNEDCALASCKAYVDMGVADGDGLYLIDPDGIGPGESFQGWCDMTTGGGGWTLVVKVRGDDAQNLLYSKWASETTLGDIGDFDLTGGTDVLYETYASVAGDELLFYDATAKCGSDRRLVQTSAFLGEKSLKQFLTDLSPLQCQYLVCNPPVGPNVTKAVFLNKGCTHPFRPSWHGKPAYWFSANKIGFNIAMYGSANMIRFTNVPNDFDAGIGSKSPPDTGYNTGDLDQLADAHSGWPGHVVTIWVR